MCLKCACVVASMGAEGGRENGLKREKIMRKMQSVVGNSLWSRRAGSLCAGWAVLTVSGRRRRLVSAAMRPTNPCLSSVSLQRPNNMVAPLWWRMNAGPKKMNGINGVTQKSPNGNNAFHYPLCSITPRHHHKRDYQQRSNYVTAQPAPSCFCSNFWHKPPARSENLVDIFLQLVLFRGHNRKGT